MKRRALTIVALLFSLSACGFHLRGSIPLPQAMAKTHIAAPAGSPLRYELESLLVGAGGEVVEEASAASAVLTVHSARIFTRILSRDALGRAREYALTLLVQYSLRDAEEKVLVQQQAVRVERDFRFDPDNVLARGAEQEMVEQEMYNAAAQQILRRLRSAAAEAPQPQAEPSAQ